LLSAVSRSVNCNTREATECVLQALHKKDEEEFTSVALEKGLTMDGKKKMDAVQVEAMLSEAGLCKNSARILFRHLNQIFERSFFELEHKRRAFLPELNFAPVVDRMVLEDKTVIDYWFKEPDVFLKHHINNIIRRDELQRVTSIDVTVGGDHGGRKFRMSLKILFQFHKMPSISRLFQIASVSHSKDDTKILHSTVLQPIGESLRIISLGGSL